MPRSQLLYSPQAARQLEELPQQTRLLVELHLENLAQFAEFAGRLPANLVQEGAYFVTEAPGARVSVSHHEAFSTVTVHQIEPFPQTSTALG